MSVDQRSKRIGCIIKRTSQAKGYPFEVPLPAGPTVSGVVLFDLIRSIDWRARRAERAGKADADTLAEVAGKQNALIGGE